MRIFVVSLVLLAFTFGSCGCTYALWENPHQTQMHVTEVRAVAEGSKGAPARAIVGYEVSGGHGNFDVALPLDSDGLPDSRFVYQGSKPTVAAILAEVGTAQRAQIHAAPLSSGKSWKKAPEHQSLRGAGWNWSPTYHVEWQDFGLAVVILSRDVKRSWPAKDSDGLQPKAESIRVLDGETVVLLPASQPRPEGDLAGAKVIASILTPVSVGVDVVIIPLYILLAITGIYSKC